MPISTNELRLIASSGGGMILDASKYSANDLKNIASSVVGSDVKIILRKIDSRSVNELRNIASAAKGCVIFDFYS